MRVEFGGIGGEIPLEAMPTGDSATLPPLTLNFTEDGTFDKQAYLEMGYTHYEVWCIGAAGGRGGGQWGPHELHYSTLNTISHGGAGGGGGLHYVLGELDGLPEGDIEVEVGTPGTDGFTRGPLDEDPPTAGTDGGHSAFVSDISEYPRASGGKGGEATRNIGGEATEDNRDPARNPGGIGGEGGIGGSITPGGGAAGGDTTLEWVGLDPLFDPHIVGSNVIPAGDGTWDLEHIGQGGGGGVGGAYIPRPVDEAEGFNRSTVIHVAGHGGVGSFSYGDTSYYGAKGTRENDPTGWPIIPGGGGGAKVGLLKYGSLASGYSPNGAVIVRLTKIG